MTGRTLNARHARPIQHPKKQTIKLAAAGSGRPSSAKKRTRAQAAESTSAPKRTRLDEAMAGYTATGEGDDDEFTVDEIVDKIRASPALLKKAGLQLATTSGADWTLSNSPASIIQGR